MTETIAEYVANDFAVVDPGGASTTSIDLDTDTASGVPTLTGPGGFALVVNVSSSVPFRFGSLGSGWTSLRGSALSQIQHAVWSGSGAPPTTVPVETGGGPLGDVYLTVTWYRNVGAAGVGARWVDTTRNGAGAYSVNPAADAATSGTFSSARLTVLTRAAVGSSAPALSSEVGGLPDTIGAIVTGLGSVGEGDEWYGVGWSGPASTIGADPGDTLDGYVAVVQLTGYDPDPPEPEPEPEIPSDRRTLIWRDADGVEFPLLFADEHPAARQIRTAGLPPVTISAAERPFRAGERVTGARWNAREVAVPVHILGDPELTADRLARALDPTRGDGTLIQTRRNGDRRYLTCRYSGGLQVTENTWVDEGWAAVLLFRAANPYWASPTRSTFSAGWSGGSIVPFFPFFPLQFGATQGVAEFSLTNSGQVPSPPRWELRGPFASIRLRDVESGVWFAIDYAAAAGETVVVDVEQGTISSGDTNLVGRLRAGSTLFDLPVGSTLIDSTIIDGAAGTQVGCSWPTLWLTA